MKRLSWCKPIAFLAAVVLLSVSLQCVALAGTYGGFTYTTGPDGDITITGYNGSATNVKIPSSINGKPVRAIGDYAFSGHSGLTGVQIPSSVTSLGYEAFSRCTGLTSVVLPSSVNSYSEYIFLNCTKLTSITFPSTLRVIPEGILSGCTALKSVTLPSGITDICSDAFNGCTNLSAISLPGSLAAIQSNAFYNCSSLQSVTIPAAVDFVGPDIFSNCAKLKKAVFRGNRPVSFYPASFDRCDPDFKVYYPVSRQASWIDFAYYPRQAYSMVTVYPQNGSASYQAIAAVKDGHIAKPAAPTRTGYTFGGWYKQSSCTAAWNFTTAVITGDISVYAKWTANKYTISATANNTGYGSVSGGGSIAYGTLVTLKATPKAGYRFVRWLEGTAAVSTSAEYKFTATKARTLKAEFAKIGTPTVKASSASYSSVKLTWAAVAGAAKYEVYRAMSSAGSYTKLTETTSTSYTNTGLTAGKVYYYKVRAKCIAGSTITYGSPTAAVVAKPVPAAPAGVAAARASASSIKVSWRAVAGATGYEVYTATASGGTYTLVKSTSSLNLTSTGLTAGKTCYYRVRAYRLVGSVKVYGSYSAVVYARP